MKKITDNPNPGPISALALTPCQTHLVLATSQNTLSHLPLPSLPTTTTTTNPLTLTPPTPFPLPSLTALSHPSPEKIYATTARGSISILSTQPTLTTLSTIPAAHNAAELTAISSLSPTTPFATAAKDATVRLWDPSTLQSITKLSGHRYDVRDLALSPSSPHLLASAGRDKTLRLWDLRSQTSVHVFRGHTGWVHAVALTALPTPTMLSCAGDKTVRVWDLVAMSERAVLTGHQYRVWDVAVASDGAFALSGSTDATVRAWDLRESCLGDVEVLDVHRDSVLCLDVATDGSFAVSGCEDGSVLMWDTATLFGRTRPEEELLVDLDDMPQKKVATSVPNQLDSVPLVAEKGDGAAVEHRVVEEDLASSEPVLPKRPVIPNPTLPPVAPQSSSARIESAKAAVTVSADQLPKYDKSAAELVNALKRIKELEAKVEDVTEQLATKSAETTALRKTVAQKEADIGLLQRQVEASKNLVNAANVRALLAANPRKADVSLDYDEPVNRIGAVSDQLSALAERLDAMIATN